MTEVTTNGAHLPEKIPDTTPGNAVNLSKIMSQQANTVLNGPAPENNVPFKDAQPQEANKISTSGNGTIPAPAPLSPRPSLTRLDSHNVFPSNSNFPISPPQARPSFQNPNQLPQRPVLQHQPSQGQFRPPPPGQVQFVQRPPLQGPGPRPPGQPGQFVSQRPVNPNFRPPTPFPRPQVQQGQPQIIQGHQRPPGIFQQRSVPAFVQRPAFTSVLSRSHTLDSTTLNDAVANNLGQEEIRPNSQNAQNRSPNMSTTSSQDHLDDERRRSNSSGSLDGRKSQTGSLENLNKSGEQSRPESRASSRMSKILEDDDKSPVSQKSVEFKLPAKDIQNGEVSVTKEEASQKKVQEEEKKISLDLKQVSKPKTEGDNDSGVDESTQGNDQSSNGDNNSPRKSSGKATNRTTSTTPTKNRSLSRNSKSPSLKSPDSTASTPGAVEKKKLPMNKIQVGSAPSPNLKVVRSKIGSLENASYKPGGGNVKIETKKLSFKAAPKIEAKNEKYAPKGGEKKIQQQKLQWNAKSKIGSLENTTHKPKGGDKKIESMKLDFKEKAKPKVGSKDNMKHVPGGGDIKIENKKLDIKVQSKVGSMDNVKHRPGGGDKKIFDDKDYLKQRSALTSENHSLSGSQNSLPSQPEVGGPVADENLNQER